MKYTEVFVKKREWKLRLEKRFEKIQSSTFYAFNRLECPRSTVDLRVREVDLSARWSLA
jgi:hypothetical protein